MKILFLCVFYSARSLLAEGLARRIRGHQADVRSAGSVPSGKMNPNAVRFLREIGIDVSRNHSKAIEELEPEFPDGLDYFGLH
ncbi:MAG: hypothetical protein H7222_00665 [Methylotenera sp.]|nr:hypothetical protein [Oligoflexia bacterium]